MPPSDTFFTHAPHWQWLIVFYFFFGGIAGGSFFWAALIDLFGKPGDRKLANLGYIVAFPALLFCPPLLTLDLPRPERFWHMLLGNHTGAPIFKPWSPMSVGSWALFIFGAFATAAFLGALAERPRPGVFRHFAFLNGGLRKLIAGVGGILGFYIAGYTGVVLAVTNRPIWADTPMLGALFLLSSAGTSAALLVWLGRNRATQASIAWLARVEGWVAVAEIIAIIATVVTLGPVASAWMNSWGVLLAVGVVLFGLLVPMFLHYRPRLLGANSIAVASALVLAGGLLLRAVVIFSSEAL
jgi:formate-dependent nitrite reductase membrane component NrfD